MINLKIMGRELKSYPCIYFNYNQTKVIKTIRHRGKMFLNPSVKSIATLIKKESKIRLIEQRPIIKIRKSNFLISPDTGSKKLNSKDPNGSFTNKRELNYPFIPVKLHLLSKKGREWIRFTKPREGSSAFHPGKA
jgi:hypothetical protein